MPFMVGRAPIRRTLKYLQSNEMKLKSSVEVMTINYNREGDNHKGAREFSFWNVAQIQYQNPNVQILSMRNMTPSPFIRLFLKNGEDILVDVDGKSASDIVDHLKKIICIPDEKLASDAKQTEVNPAHFGWGCDRQCICEISGQLPCPGVVQLPRVMRRKYIHNPDLLEDYAHYNEVEEEEVD